jgi:hypothetical protein
MTETATATRQRRNLHPASGRLTTAVLIMADRIATAERQATACHFLNLHEQADRHDRTARRRSRALERLVHALERHCQQRCCRRVAHLH